MFEKIKKARVRSDQKQAQSNFKVPHQKLRLEKLNRSPGSTIE